MSVADGSLFALDEDTEELLVWSDSGNLPTFKRVVDFQCLPPLQIKANYDFICVDEGVHSMHYGAWGGHFGQHFAV